MKLATLPDGHPDGALHIVSRDLRQAVGAASAGFRTVQAALENWAAAEPALRALAADLEAGRAEGATLFEPHRAMAPLPRAWQWLDGSAFPSHSNLMQRVFGLNPLPDDYPLMYQGLSHLFHGPADPVPFVDEEDGIDFEGEFAVVTGPVPMATGADAAQSHILLVMLVNDWSLRRIAPREMKTGFGWVQAKPPCSAAPVAVTPDELGAAWAASRVHLQLEVSWNGARFGAADGGAMAYGFDELVAHAAARRPLVAGTIVGSGTVSNENYREIGSSCIAERRGIEIVDHGEAATGYMRFGDVVRMEAHDADGMSVFGAIEQRVERLG